MNKKSVIYNMLSAVIMLIALLADIISKIWAKSTLMGKDDIVIIDGVIRFHYLENRGAAFGMLQNQRIFFIIITIIFAVIFAYMYVRIPSDKRFFPLKITLVMIFCGAVGNFIDRALRGYVVDFIYFELIDFPVFNIADVYITFAAAVLVLLVMFYYKDEELDRVFHKKKDEQIEQQ